MILDVDTNRYVREVIEGGEYSYVFKDLVVIDAGCNIGTFSLWIYDLARQIYAIDLAKENIDSLNKLIDHNNLSRIKTFNVALAGKSGKRSINFGGFPASYGGWQLDGHDGYVDAISLAQFINKQGIEYIDILKMDIEGSEYEVLNAEDFPSDKIRTIIGEIHLDPQKDPSEIMRIEIKTHLEELGYRYTEYPVNHFIARKI